MQQFKCQCCGFEKQFENEEAAFQAGWDCPPRFSYVTCDLCPGTCIVLNIGHEKAHEFWKTNGRPAEFNFDCVQDDNWRDSEMWEDFQIKVNRLKKLVS